MHNESFPFSNMFKSFVFSWFIARHWQLVSVSPSSALLMVLEPFQIKLLWNSWPPNCHLTAPILPPKLSPSFLRPLLHTLCLEIFSSLLQKPVQIFHIIQQARITSSSLISMQFFLVSQNHMDVCLTEHQGSSTAVSSSKLTAKVNVPSRYEIISVPPPDKTATHRAFPHLSSLGSAWSSLLSADPKEIVSASVCYPEIL